MKTLLYILMALLNLNAHSESNIDHLFALSLEEILKIKVTGSTLTHESIKTVPAAVTVFHYEQFSGMGINYLYELLNLVPGFQSQRSADFSLNYTFSSRGRRNEFQAKEILIVMDGRRLNDPRTDSVNTTLPLILLEQIERVEVIRGPGSAIYGSSAFMGVINIITRRGISQSSLTLGDLGQASAHQFYSYSENNWQLDMFAQAQRDSGQNYLLNDSFSDEKIVTSDPMQAGQFDLAISHKESVIRASIRQSNSQDFYLLDRLSNGFNHYNIRQNMLSIEHKFPINKVSSKLFFSYQLAQQDFHVQLTAPGTLAQASAPSSQQPWRMKGDFHGSSLQFKSHNDLAIDELSSIQFGFEVRRDKEVLGESANNFDVAKILVNDYPIAGNDDFSHILKIGTEKSRDVMGGFLQYRYLFGADTHALMGLRIDKYTQIDRQLSPRLSLVHQLNNEQTFKVLYGEAFRAPSLNETGLINNVILLGNPNLEHEVVKTWDLLWQGLWENHGVTAGWFQNEFSKPIVQTLDNETIRTWVNGASSRSQGFELEAQHQLEYAWLIRLGMTRLYKLPDTAFRESSTLASIVVNYEQDRWNGNLGVVFHSTRQMLTPSGLLDLGEYWQVNGKFQYHVSDESEWFVQIKNMLDKDIFTPAQGSIIEHGIPNRGRAVSVGGLWRF